MIVVCGKDKFWCCGLNVNLARLTIPAEFTGQNMLGQLLQEFASIYAVLMLVKC